jgi:putative ABC transport system permease protein
MGNPRPSWNVQIPVRLFFSIFGQIFRTLWAHKLRSILTMFGIAWGVGSLLLLVGLGEGFRTGNRKQMESIGENALFIWGGRAPVVQGNQNSGRWYHLTYQDYLDISKAPYVRAASPAINRSDLKVVSDYSSIAPQVMGVEPQFKGIRFIPIKRGRWLNEADLAQSRTIALIGTEVVKNLFPGGEPLGKPILINGLRFEVVGIIDQIGRGDNVGPNTRIIIPFTTMQKYFPEKGENRAGALTMVNYQPRERGENELAKAEVHKIIGRNHGFDWHDEDAFDEWDTVKNSEMVGKIFDAMNMFLGAVGMVTLLLGAIGVVNIMLVAVSERTREIGLRKALGATNRSVMTQFFFEGMILTVFSGCVGIAAAAGLMAALGTLPQPPGFDTPKLVPSSAILAVGSLAICGVIAALYPARQAAMLTPVEALRSE